MSSATNKQGRPQIVFFLVCLLVAFICGWLLMYPSSSDRKNIKYVLWKAGLYRLNLDVATAAMIGDPSGDKLVVGKTKTQLRDRFGSLLSPAEATPYLRNCYQNSPWKEKQVLFIAQSSWMIVFAGDGAINLVLIKGC